MNYHDENSTLFSHVQSKKAPKAGLLLEVNARSATQKYWVGWQSETFGNRNKNNAGRFQIKKRAGMWLGKLLETRI